MAKTSTGNSATAVEKIVLDEKNEFEAALIDVVKMHRLKSQSYGSSDDPLLNFILGGHAINSTPLRYGEALIQKHNGAIRQWFSREKDCTIDPKPNATADDGFLDRTVYAVLLLVLYRRLKK